MRIIFSRHAKRRAELYQIPEEKVGNILGRLNFSPGEHEIIQAIDGFELPIKIIVSVEGETITVVTNYPLKKGRKK